MNQLISAVSPGEVTAPGLVDWLLARGIAGVSTADIAHLLGVPVSQVRQRVALLRKRNMLVSPARGFWVPVAPEYRAGGAAEPFVYIDSMMHFLGQEYCVGWLTAAALRGASHQAPQVFQVATSGKSHNVQVGSYRLDFVHRGFCGEVAAPELTLRHGRARVASPGTVALMVAGDLELTGGLDNAATVILELSENKGFIAGVQDNAAFFSAAALRRLGWILDTFSEDETIRSALSGLEKTASAAGTSLSFLSPTDPRKGSVNRTWNLLINREVEPDQ